jgi:IstB-like ATP binding protein
MCHHHLAADCRLCSSPANAGTETPLRGSTGRKTDQKLATCSPARKQDLLAAGGFIAQQRNVVLVGGTGTGKTHLAVARGCIRAGSRGRFFTTVDLVNQLEAESRTGRQGRIPITSPASTSSFSMNWVISPSLRPAASCCSILSAVSMSAPLSS